jgi:hypothetical protein
MPDWQGLRLLAKQIEIYVLPNASAFKVMSGASQGRARVKMLLK